jgi:hypothetical protein
MTGGRAGWPAERPNDGKAGHFRRPAGIMLGFLSASSKAPPSMRSSSSSALTCRLNAMSESTALSRRSK